MVNDIMENMKIPLSVYWLHNQLPWCLVPEDETH